MAYQRKDARYRQAKAEGYRARSAYKLLEIDRRVRLLRAGARVVDLGAWPGGWLQVAAERVQPHGRVLGVDLLAIAPLPHAHVETLVGDCTDPRLIEAVRERLGGPADVVLCDAAPKLTGIRPRDEACCEELTNAVIASIPSLLVPGGSLLMKAFMNSEHAGLSKRLRDCFEEVRSIRPRSSRQGSAEFYVLGRNFHPEACR